MWKDLCWFRRHLDAVGCQSVCLKKPISTRRQKLPSSELNSHLLHRKTPSHFHRSKGESSQCFSGPNQGPRGLDKRTRRTQLYIIQKLNLRVFVNSIQKLATVDKRNWERKINLWLTFASHSGCSTLARVYDKYWEFEVDGPSGASTLGSDLSCTMASAGVRTCSSFLSNLLWSLWLDCWRHNDYQRAGVTWSRSDDDSVGLGESSLVVRLKSFTSFTLTMGHHHQHNKEPNSKSLEPEIQNIPNLQKSDEVRKPNHTKITKKY